MLPSGLTFKVAMYNGRNGWFGFTFSLKKNEWIVAACIIGVL